MDRHGVIISSDDEDIVLIDQDDVSNYNEDDILPEGWIVLDQSIPGSGKSVFAASLAHELSEGSAPVLFFFFRQIIDANHKPANLPRDWLDQVLIDSLPLQATLKVYVEAERSLDSISIDDLWRHLRTASAQLPLVYCDADVLGEIDQENDDFLHALADSGHWRPSSVKVLMTSQPVIAVETPLRQRKHIDIRLEERFVGIDIATYVNYSLKSSHLSEDDKKLIKSAALGRANGLFLYAKLAVNAFMEPNADIASILSRLSRDCHWI
ncbi:Fc.00g008360.m01.CDS01 [Cosmosporella sp. VM-42]